MSSETLRHASLSMLANHTQMRYAVMILEGCSFLARASVGTKICKLGSAALLQ